MIPDKQKNSGKGRLGAAKGDREAIRQCFLFSNHLIVTTRTQAYHAQTINNTYGYDKLNTVNNTVLVGRKGCSLI